MNQGMGQMGPELLKEVERQLTLDLNFYGYDITDIKFDWSETIVEGHCSDWLDGQIDNLSGIALYSKDEFIGHGWMEFVEDFTEDINDPDNILIFWEFLTVENKEVKNVVGIPEHIFAKLCPQAQEVWDEYQMKSTSK